MTPGHAHALCSAFFALCLGKAAILLISILACPGIAGIIKIHLESFPGLADAENGALMPNKSF